MLVQVVELNFAPKCFRYQSVSHSHYTMSMTSNDGSPYREFIKQLPFDPYNVDLDALKILSTIRYDPGLTPSIPTLVEEVERANFFLFPEHIKRLKFTADFFSSSLKHEKLVEDLFPYEITEKFIFNQLKKALQDSQARLDSPYKFRLLVEMNGQVRVEIHETPIRWNLLDGLDDLFPDSERFDVYVDTTPVLPSPFTSFKTTHRTVYSEARSRALPGIRPGKEEVVLVNSTNQVMEGSITNIAVKNEKGQWITPQLTSGCLCGVTRNMLLRRQFIFEGNVNKDSLTVGQDVLLFNGIIGVVRGTIMNII